MEQGNDNRNLYTNETFTKRKNNNVKEYGILLMFILIISGIIAICYINFDKIIEFIEEYSEYDEDYNYTYDDYEVEEDYVQIDECYECYIDQSEILEDDLKIAQLFFTDYLGTIENYRIINAEYLDGWFMMEYVTYVYEDGTYDSVYAETYNFIDYKVTTLKAQDKDLEDSIYTIYNIKNSETNNSIKALAIQSSYLTDEVTMEDIENLLGYLISIDTGELAVLYNSNQYVLTTKTYSNYSIEYKFVDSSNYNNTITLRCSDNCVKEWNVYGTSNVNNFGESINVTFDGTFYYLDYELILDDSQYLKAKEFVGNKYE